MFDLTYVAGNEETPLTKTERAVVVLVVLVGLGLPFIPIRLILARPCGR